MYNMANIDVHSFINNINRLLLVLMSVTTEQHLKSNVSALGKWSSEGFLARVPATHLA